MTKILIVDTPRLLNKGGMAAIMGALRALRESLPDAQITLLCHHWTEDSAILSDICLKYSVKVIKHPCLKEHPSKKRMLIQSLMPAFFTTILCGWGRVSRKLGIPARGIFNESDMVLSLCIDTLHDHYGLFYPIWTLFNQLLGIIAGKPVVVWGAGIGRFKRTYTRLLAKFILNRVSLIITREEVSKDYVKSMGVNRPRVMATADHAFMMEPVSHQRIDEIFKSEHIHSGEKPTVILIPSQLIVRYAFTDISGKGAKHQIHAEILSKVADYINEKTDADILMIAHSSNDQQLIEQISKMVKNPSKTKFLQGDYLADELKGIISRCDMVIGERMHSMIASTSMGIPTVGVIYGEKAYGILGKMMLQNEHMIEIGQYSPDELLEKMKDTVNKVWGNKESIHLLLKQCTEKATEKARLNGTLVKELADSIRKTLKIPENIETTVKSGLCTGCGTCAGVCPKKSINMLVDPRKQIYTPHLNGNCTVCRQCVEVCPGKAMDFKKFNREIFDKEPDSTLGNYKQCFKGYSNDHDVRYYSSSGGLVTALLIFALEHQLIHGALVTRMKKDNPLEPETFIARSKEEIIEASRSKYCPVPANIALKEILEAGNGERFAVVGLPCHIQGIRKAEQLNRKLRERIYLHFGLVCSHNDNFRATKYILQKYGISPSEINHLDYRGYGWPGQMMADTKSRGKTFIAYKEYKKYHELNFYTPSRCLLCGDFLNGLADISFMDAWIPEIRSQDQIGSSFIVARNDIGQNICLSARDKGVIELSEISENDIIRSQGKNRLSNRDLKAHYFLTSIRGQSVPNYNMDIPGPRLVNYVRVLITYFNSLIGSNPYCQKIIGPLSSVESRIFSKLRTRM